MNIVCNAFSWMVIGVPCGHVIATLVNDVHERSYNRSMPLICTYSIVAGVTFLAFLRGYTGKDLITNAGML